MSRVKPPAPPEPHRRSKVWPRIGIAISALVTIVSLVILALMIWPSQNFDYPQRPKVISSEFTSDGTPVVREGDDLQLEISFCNNGTNTYTRRWADLWAPLVEDGPLRRLGAFEVPAIQSFSGDNDRDVGCIYNAEQPIGLPSYLDPNRYYEFRLRTEWQVNPIRVDHVSTVSERFYLAEAGASTP